MAAELNWEVLLAVAGYLAMSTVLIVGVYLSRKEIRRIRGKAEPLMDKASSALDRMEAMEERLADLQMVPATIVVGIENAMKAQLETQGSPLRLYTRALIDEGTSALAETFSKQFEAVSKLLPAAKTILSKAGVEGKADKREGRAVVEELLKEFGPARKLVEKFVPKSMMEDPVEFLGYLANAKQKIAAFSPQIGAQLDSMLEQILLGGMTEAPTEGIAGIVPGNLVRMLPAGAPKASSTSDYMRE